MDSARETKSKRTKIRKFYRISKLLGQGAFGEVRTCVHIELSTQRAVKIIKMTKLDDVAKKVQMNEVEILK